MTWSPWSTGARTRAAEALERTPELLEALARAGVVDAGGAGYLLLLDALLFVADGRPLPEPPEVAPVRALSVAGTGGPARRRGGRG